MWVVGVMLIVVVIIGVVCVEGIVGSMWMWIGLIECCVIGVLVGWGKKGVGDEVGKFLFVDVGVCCCCVLWRMFVVVWIEGCFWVVWGSVLCIGSVCVSEVWVG